MSTTVNDRYSGDRFSGNDGFSGTKNPDGAILFTAIVWPFLGGLSKIVAKLLTSCV